MPLLDMQRKYRELGRLRTGIKAETQSGKMRPSKLDTWRVTSSSEHLLDEIAVLHGGEVRPWEGAPNEGDNYELVTETDTLPVLIPPGSRVFSQYWELWKGGGCQKRCDGVNQVLVLRKCSCPSIENGERTDAAKEGKACVPITRLQVMLPGVSDYGIFRLETHSYNAAQEMMTVFDARDLEQVESLFIPARIRIEQRSAKKDGKTSRFIVPVIELEGKLADAVRSLSELGANVGTPLELNAPVTEGRTLAGEPPALPTATETPVEDVWGPADITNFNPAPIEAPEDEPTNATVAAAVHPDQVPTRTLPSWVMELSGTDGEILDAAMEVAAKRGKAIQITTLEHLASLPISEESRTEIAALLEQKHASQGTLA